MLNKADGGFMIRCDAFDRQNLTLAESLVQHFHACFEVCGVVGLEVHQIGRFLIRWGILRPHRLVNGFAVLVRAFSIRGAVGRWTAVPAGISRPRRAAVAHAR